MKKDIEDYVQDEGLRAGMERISKIKKNRERIEKRTAYTTSEVSWLDGRAEWAGLRCIGAVHTEIESKKGKTEE